MSRIKRPRNKAHKPCRPSIPMTIRFNSADELILQLVPHQELAKLIAGDGDAVSWNTITARLNLGMTLAAGLFTGASQTMTASLNAICDVRDRFQRVGKYGVSGNEAQMIGAGLVMCDELQKNCTRRELRAAIEYVYLEGAL